MVLVPGVYVSVMVLVPGIYVSVMVLVPGVYVSVMVLVPGVYGVGPWCLCLCLVQCKESWFTLIEKGVRIIADFCPLVG